MKPVSVVSAVLWVAVLPVLAEDPAPVPALPWQAEATLIHDESHRETVWITGACATVITCREQEHAAATMERRRAEIKAVYFHELPALTAAMELFQGRRYAEAKARFAGIKEALKALRDLPNNPGTLAAFHELECLRRLNDLDGLAKALEGFRREGLTRGHQLRQVDLYVLWEAVRRKDWPRLDALCEERRQEKLPGYQRAQVGYCHGLALEALARPQEALNAYATAITADCGASEEITRQAALHSLNILNRDPEVGLAIKTWGTPEEKPDSRGCLRLQEAAALAAMYELTLGSGKPLPAEYKELPHYQRKGGEVPE